MKTVRDAVIALGGSMKGAGLCWHGCFCDSWRITPNNVQVTEHYLVCTYDQFNTEVCSMSNHAGRIEYVNYLAADKTLLEKEAKVVHTSEEFWKDAPEGSQLVQAGCTLFHTTYIKDLLPTEYTVWITNKNIWRTVAGRPNAQRPLISRPKPSPVFTQAMADNGELPSVGSEFIDTYNDDDDVTCKSLMHDSGKVIYSVESDGETCHFSCTKDKCKPIDTRTDEEKAIDEACLVIDDSRRCIKANTNIDCSVAMKAVIITLIKNGWSKS